MSTGTFYLILMIVIMIPFVPFIMYNYKEIKSSKKQALIYGILSTMINFLILTQLNLKTQYLILLTFVPSAMGTLFNYLIIKKDIAIKQIPKTVIIFLIFMFSSLFQLIIIPFLDYDIKNLTPTQNLILSTFSDSVLLIILGIIYFKTLKEDLKKLKGNTHSIFDTAIKYWLVGLLVMVVSNLIIGSLTTANANNEESVQEIIKSTKYFSLIAIGIMGPIIEELVFRKSFRDLFTNDKVFILASGLIFGSLHVIIDFKSVVDMLYVIPYSSLGIAFAAMYVKTDNIYTSMFMHIFHNTVLSTLSIVTLGVIL